jgi:hypothetical protein
MENKNQEGESKQNTNGAESKLLKKKRNRSKLPFPTENFSLPPREHKKVNYAEFETFSDSSSENNKRQNHGNYISWSSTEDAILIEQVQKFLESQKCLM